MMTMKKYRSEKMRTAKVFKTKKKCGNYSFYQFYIKKFSTDFNSYIKPMMTLVLIFLSRSLAMISRFLIPSSSSQSISRSNSMQFEQTTVSPYRLLSKLNRFQKHTPNRDCNSLSLSRLLLHTVTCITSDRIQFEMSHSLIFARQ